MIAVRSVVRREFAGLLFDPQPLYDVDFDDGDKEAAVPASRVRAKQGEAAAADFEDEDFEDEDFEDEDFEDEDFEDEDGNAGAAAAAAEGGGGKPRRRGVQWSMQPPAVQERERTEPGEVQALFYNAEVESCPALPCLAACRELAACRRMRTACRLSNGSQTALKRLSGRI